MFARQNSNTMSSGVLERLVASFGAELDQLNRYALFAYICSVERSRCLRRTFFPFCTLLARTNALCEAHQECNVYIFIVVAMPILKRSVAL